MTTTIILALSFGKPSDASSNLAIVSIARRIAEYLNAPIVSDKSIPLNSFLDDVVFIGPPVDQHESTIKLAEAFSNLHGMKEGRFDRVIIVSAPDYLPRAVRDVTETIKRRRISCEIERWDEIEYIRGIHEKYQWYDPKSTQLWTRYRFLFLLYKTILDLMPSWLYKIIAS